MGKYGFYERLPTLETQQKIEKFCELLVARKDEIVLLATDATRTGSFFHQDDLSYSCMKVKHLLFELVVKENIMYRPKGRILMGLSANEPLIVGIIPVVAALLAGNNLIVRSASKNRVLMQTIINLLHKSGFTPSDISLMDQNRDQVIQVIKMSDYVFWFGSFLTCKEIASTCLSFEVPIDYEAEGYDIAVIDDTVNEKQIFQVVEAILGSVVRHNGQICQAVRGIFIHEKGIPHFLEVLERAILTKAIQIEMIDRPGYNISVFSQKVWYSFYNNKDELINKLIPNPYRLTLNIYSNKSKEENMEIASHYKCSRLLINDYPEKVGYEEPWGGLGYSGTRGLTKWMEKFVDLTLMRKGNVI